MQEKTKNYMDAWLALIYLGLIAFICMIEIVFLIIVWNIWQPHIELIAILKIVLVVIIVNSCRFLYNEWSDLRHRI